MTGLGTIDIMKTKETKNLPDDSPMQLEDIFGIGLRINWLLPTDPLFADYDKTLGYSMPKRLLREGREHGSFC